MKLTQVTVKLSIGKSFDVWVNCPKVIHSAIANWEVRTNKYTDRSLCDYINSKREKGMTNHYAYTNNDIAKIQSEINKQQNGNKKDN